MDQPEPQSLSLRIPRMIHCDRRFITFTMADNVDKRTNIIRRAARDKQHRNEKTAVKFHTNGIERIVYNFRRGLLYL